MYVLSLLSRDTSSGDAALKRTATRILSVWEERNVFTTELRKTLHNLLGEYDTCHVVVTGGNVNIYRTTSRC